MDEVAQVEEVGDEEAPMVVKSSAGLEEGVSPHPRWQECHEDAPPFGPLLHALGR